MTGGLNIWNDVFGWEKEHGLLCKWGNWPQIGSSLVMKEKVENMDSQIDETPLIARDPAPLVRALDPPSVSSSPAVCSETGRIA